MIIPRSAAPICSLKQVRIEEIICELYFNKFSSKLENSLFNCISGQKLSLSEQLTALVMFQLPFYGLLSGAVPLIFYIGKIHCHFIF